MLLLHIPVANQTKPKYSQLKFVFFPLSLWYCVLNNKRTATLGKHHKFTNFIAFCWNNTRCYNNKSVQSRIQIYGNSIQANGSQQYSCDYTKHKQSMAGHLIGMYSGINCFCWDLDVELILNFTKLFVGQRIGSWAEEMLQHDIWKVFHVHLCLVYKYTILLYKR